MTTVDSATRDTGVPKAVKKIDLKLEVVVIPVADADRSKEFYERLGWRLDADFAFDNGFRVVQFTPPGIGAPRSSSAPRSRRRPPAAPRACTSSSRTSRRPGASSAASASEVSDVFHPGAPGAQFRADGAEPRSGPAPEHASYWLLRDLRRP